ncbi:MAG TPA: hypothetical protein DCR97_06780 [Deltaproteobacteria bacterium]|nr:hypothetical protein [Deltaproteobacteria bacterium]
MKIHVNLGGIPILFKTLKRKELDVEFSGATLRDLIDDLVRRYGMPIKKALLDSSGDVDLEIRVVRNNVYLTEDRMDVILQEGDILAFRGAS